MRSIVAGLMLLSSAAHAGEAEPACAIPGEVIQWAADYCMLELQTDDEIAAGDCIAEQIERPFASACAAKAHFKRAMCTRRVAAGAPAAIERCVDDPDFMGDTVRNDGVGG